jgi:hypothetical protein
VLLVKRFAFGFIIFVMLAGLGFAYKKFDPAKHSFPACPFLKVTGYKCPGCGSQRAIHHLLNGDIKQAFYLNPLLILAIPYILVGWILDFSKLSGAGLKFRNTFYGQKAIMVVLIIIVGFWVGRNVI